MIVVTPEVTSIRDADKVIGILDSRGLEEISLIVNRIRPKMVRTEDMMSIEDIQDILGVPLIGVIPDSARVIIASNRGEPLVLEDTLSTPGLAFEHTARRLAGEEIEFLDLEQTKGKNPVKRLLRRLMRRPKPEN